MLINTSCFAEATAAHRIVKLLQAKHTKTTQQHSINHVCVAKSVLSPVHALQKQLQHRHATSCYKRNTKKTAQQKQPNSTASITLLTPVLCSLLLPALQKQLQLKEWRSYCKQSTRSQPNKHSPTAQHQSRLPCVNMLKPD